MEGCESKSRMTSIDCAATDEIGAEYFNNMLTHTDIDNHAYTINLAVEIIFAG
jgi:hypothetical protein